KNNSVTITKVNGKKLNLKKNFKVKVVAKKDGKKLANTIAGHVVGRKNSKYTNAKNIKLITKEISVEKGKTAKVQAKTVLVDKKKKQLTNAHATEFRYASSDKSIATVSKKGVVTGKSAGTCTVYVYSRNGLAKTVKVTVK
ncbi:MAG: Ig-like domain-containing protein, partial [Lachnospiraceae bacterium]|nr:Ig-like domain-containing protein [Lachnospiraceae bacterium]